MIGRVQIQGPVFTLGYHESGDVGQNRTGFTGDGWLRTGDLGFLRDGRLTITGRESERIVVNGVNCAPSEIEASLAEIPGLESSSVAACAVEESRGTGEGLTIFFYARPGPNIELAELLDRIRGNLK